MKIGQKTDAEILVETLSAADAFSNLEKENESRSALRTVFDNGCFKRLSAFMTDSEESSETESVECGYGSVGGKPVFAFAEDSGKLSGAVSSRHVEKIKSLYKRALGSGTPVIAVFDSIGGKIEEGSSLLSAYGELAKCVSAAKGILPQIAIVKGKCTGILSSIAQMYDFVITTEESEMYFFPPLSVGECSEKEINGICAYEAKNYKDATDFAKKLISVLPLNKKYSKYVKDCEDDINRIIPEGFAKGNDVSELISEISDDKEFIQLYEEYGKSVTVGFSLFDGILTGVVANNGSVNEGAISKEGAEKAKRFIDFCSSFGISILTLVDTVGFEVSKENEEAGIMTEAADLMLAYSKANVAKVTVIVGKAYGAGFTVMGSRSLGADEVIALKSASIAVMPPERAVAFCENDEITPEKRRNEVEAEWLMKNSPAVLAAAKGDIDDVADFQNLRSHVVFAIGMFSSKSVDALGIL